MSGTDIAAEVAAALSEAGAETGTGAPLTGTIMRVTDPDETTYPPTPGSEKTYSFTAGLEGFAFADRDGIQITARDVKVMVSRPVRAEDGEEIEPENGDSLTVAGKTYSIVNVDAEAFGGYAIMWTCQCRSADS